MKCRIRMLNKDELILTIKDRDDVFVPLRLGHRLLILDNKCINIRSIAYVEFMD